MLFGTESIELMLLDGIQKLLRCSFLDFLMTKITMLGNAGAIWILLAVIFLCTKKHRKTGIMLSLVLVLDLFIGNLIMKNLFQRPRPCRLNESIELLIAVPKDFSFPSGHTLASFSSAFLLSKRDRRMGTAAIVLAALIAFSRMYLYVHFPTDILGGILVGYFIASTVNILGKYIQ